MTMKLTHSRRSSRTGFTLIELLVVIAILTILVSLITAAVMKFLVKGPETVTRQEIGQLDAAVATFHTEFKLGKEYFPSQLVLCELATDYVLTNQVDRDSVAFLNRMFPAILKPDARPASPTYGKIIWQTVGIDWNNNGVIDRGRLILEGDQCLVFFLGGIPTAPGQTYGCLGFSYLGSNPATPPLTQGEQRKGPYFEFKSAKLLQLRNNDNTNPGVNRYFSYQDGYGNPNGVYVYFSSYTRPNGYNPYGGTDCPSFGVQPYYESVSNQGVRYLNPNTCQIISAGVDGLFGPGGAYNPAAPSNTAQTAKDDQSNFHNHLIGLPD
jgi:prepilin-type N-terminal cleavage/methylation domain-containing protein